ncbi:PREDICTED: uncharacterized protein LOC109481670 [Branchiostoma belcheri]|uniref:Uncharacterized protein LOC109481670 n=1 Tax=Branchiostoma belcheri TaxID=7741 RepID=A0A6P5A0F9_BRABE|nr:PREDICTED: uncharacterized protein LOC109481670 [Branchiostoma belcheri]
MPCELTNAPDVKLPYVPPLAASDTLRSGHGPHKKTLAVSFLITFLLTCVAEERQTGDTTGTIDNWLKSRLYDRFLRPNFGREPVHVNLSLTVASIDLISEVNMPSEPVPRRGNSQKLRLSAGDLLVIPNSRL